MQKTVLYGVWALFHGYTLGPSGRPFRVIVDKRSGETVRVHVYKRPAALGFLSNAFWIQLAWIVQASELIVTFLGFGECNLCLQSEGTDYSVYKVVARSKHPGSKESTVLRRSPHVPLYLVILDPVCPNRSVCCKRLFHSTRN